MTREEALVAYAADHALMAWQREERRLTKRPLRAGDFIQAHVGGEIREVVEAGSAGDVLESRANHWAREAREPRVDNRG